MVPAGPFGGGAVEGDEACTHDSAPGFDGDGCFLPPGRLFAMDAGTAPVRVRGKARFQGRGTAVETNARPPADGPQGGVQDKEGAQNCRVTMRALVSSMATWKPLAS